MKINIIGAGHVGKSLGRLIVNYKAGEIQAAYNRTPERAAAAVAFIGQGRAITHLSQLPKADLTLITTPDDAIAGTCDQLVNLGCIQPNSIVAHCSGALTSDVLTSAKKINGSLASIHPIKSFADPAQSVTTFTHTFCSIEGDNLAKETLNSLLLAISAKPFFIEKSQKMLYHAAGVFAANYLVTLYHSALSCMQQAEIDPQISQEVIISLMQDTLTNVVHKKDAADALTGPIKRGDSQTVAAHLHALEETNFKNLYAALGQYTLPLTTHKEAIKNNLRNILKT